MPDMQTLTVAPHTHLATPCKLGWQDRTAWDMHNTLQRSKGNIHVPCVEAGSMCHIMGHTHGPLSRGMHRSVTSASAYWTVTKCLLAPLSMGQARTHVARVATRQSCARRCISIRGTATPRARQNPPAPCSQSKHLKRLVSCCHAERAELVACCTAHGTPGVRQVGVVCKSVDHN
jgi:hypothetical protein